MALKQVKDYYKGIEKLYFELVNDLREMEEEFKEGNVTEEELNKLLIPVNNIKDNYLRLSYILHLFYQPNKDKKVSKYNNQHKDLVNVFKENKITKEQELENSRYALDEFKKNLDDFKKELNKDGQK